MNFMRTTWQSLSARPIRRRVEQVNGELYNVEFATIEAVKDPFHGGKK